MTLKRSSRLFLALLFNMFIFASIIQAKPQNNPAIKRFDQKTKPALVKNRFAEANSSTPLLPKTVAIPGGCFQMGSPDYENNRNDNETSHRVCVKRFNMAIHEVTVAEFKAFVADTQYFTDAEIDYLAPGCWSFNPGTQANHWNWWPWSSWRTPLKHKLRDDEPVTCVSFYDIHQYIDWLNKATGRHYRLPTEAEWEYAARAGTNTAYFWGNNPDLSCRYANAADLTEFSNITWPEPHRCHDGSFFSSPTKSYLPNKFGLYDMLGNAWEWTCSEYLKEYTGQEQHCLDNPNGDNFIAVRGGGWNADPVRLRAAYRNWHSPWVRMSTWGFRLVKDERY